MKPLIWAISLALMLPITGFSQTASVRHFYHKYKHGENTEHFVIPGWLTRSFINLAIRYDKDMSPSEKSALRVLKHFSRVRLLMIDEGSTVKTEDVNSLIQNLHGEHFEDLIYVHDEDTEVNIMVREKRNMIRNLMVLVKDGDSFIMFSVSGKLKKKTLSKILKEIEKEDGLKLKKSSAPSPVKEEVRA